MVREELDEACQSELAETKAKLERVCELYLRTREKNEVIIRKNESLSKRLGLLKLRLMIYYAR